MNTKLKAKVKDVLARLYNNNNIADVNVSAGQLTNRQPRHDVSLRGGHLVTEGGCDV